MRINIDHITKYTFSAPTKSVIQNLRLTPHSNAMQNILSWDINVDCNACLYPFTDAFGNSCHILSIDEPVSECTIEVIGKVDTYPTSGVTDEFDESIPLSVYKRFTRLVNMTKDIQEFAKDIATETTDLGQAHQIMRSIFERMEFDKTSTDATTDAAEAFNAKKGVCQDYAHIFLACTRELGIASRYVSGHLLQSNGIEQQEASHAWAECYIKGLGWVAFDAANSICADEHYVKVAVGLDYHDAAPIAGSRYGGGVETMAVDLNVRKAKTNFQSQSQ